MVSIGYYCGKAICSGLIFIFHTNMTFTVEEDGKRTYDIDKNNFLGE